MKRLILIVCVAGSLLAAASLELFHVSPRQERENLAQWQRMAETERESLRQTWRKFSALEGVQRESARRRLATVSRVLQRREQRSGEPVSHAELLRILRQYPEQLQQVLDRHQLPAGPLRERLKQRTRTLVLSFLEDLSAQGRLDVSERQRLEALSYSELISESLDLQKREEIFLYAEGAPPLQSVDVLSLADQSPLDVAEKMREARRRRGLLGRASRLFGLSSADRTLLAEISDEDLVSGLRTLIEPKVRKHLESKGWAEADIARILAQPFRKLERTLDRIEREGR